MLRAARVLGAVLISYLQLQGFRRSSPATRAASTAPQKFADRLLQLGPVFIKIGQMLSTRPDVLPREYTTALQRLQEAVPPMPFAEVESVLRAAFGDRPVDSIYSTIERIPTASASVAQVHFATLVSGEEVAVKVQRLGVEQSIRRDLRMLGALTHIAAFAVPGIVRAFNLRDGLKEFSRYTLQELDFAIEARTMLAFRANFASWPDVLIPKPFLPYVTRCVLTMERVSGKRVDVIVDSLSPEQRAALGERLLEIEMKMFISDGLFHADLHPGNIFFKDDGTIVLLDFGMYGRLTDEHRDHFMLYWFYGLQRRTKMSFRHLIAQTTSRADADEAGYYAYFRTVAATFYDSTITTQSITQTYLQIIIAGAKFGFVFPSDLLLQAKALTTAEALAFVLTPNLRFEDAAQPIIAREFAQRIADPRRLRRRLEDALPELLLFGRLPADQSTADDGNDEISTRIWSSVAFALLERAKTFRPGIALFRAFIDPTAAGLLRLRYGAEGPAVLDEMWADASRRWAGLSPQTTLGATITVRLAAATAAAYDTLLARAASPEEATHTVYDIAWGVYQKMGAAAWATSGALSKDGTERLRLATIAFRTFPFSAPSYEWRAVDGVAGEVNFDCLRCPVAEYFESLDRSELCVRTWCALDFPLATELWDATLVRSGSIAGGAPFCDFRWHSQPVA